MEGVLYIAEFKKLDGTYFLRVNSSLVLATEFMFGYAEVYLFKCLSCYLNEMYESLTDCSILIYRCMSLEIAKIKMKNLKEFILKEGGLLE